MELYYKENQTDDDVECGIFNESFKNDHVDHRISVNDTLACTNRIISAQMNTHESRDNIRIYLLVT